jgi:hypothetical protein
MCISDEQADAHPTASRPSTNDRECPNENRTVSPSALQLAFAARLASDGLLLLTSEAFVRINFPYQRNQAV